MNDKPKKPKTPKKPRAKKAKSTRAAREGSVKPQFPSLTRTFQAPGMVGTEIAPDAPEDVSWDTLINQAFGLTDEEAARLQQEWHAKHGTPMDEEQEDGERRPEGRGEGDGPTR
jgi:hypothetical protein